MMGAGSVEINSRMRNPSPFDFEMVFKNGKSVCWVSTAPTGRSSSKNLPPEANLITCERYRASDPYCCRIAGAKMLDLANSDHPAGDSPLKSDQLPV